MNHPFLSQMTAFGCNFALKGWSFCDGEHVLINQNQALFSLLGTAFGGNGRTNFYLPDLRGRTPLGYGEGVERENYRLGQSGGENSIRLRQDQLPTASYDIKDGNAEVQPVTSNLVASDSYPTTNDPANSFQATFPPNQPVYADNLLPPIKPFSEFSVPGQNATVTGKVGPIGDDQPVDIRSPYLAVNWQICVSGAFPNRH